MKLSEGDYRIVDAVTGKVRGKAFKRLEWAEAHAHHLSQVTGRRFVVARVVRKV